LEAFDRVLEDSANEMTEQRPNWIQSGQEAFDLWLNKYIQPALLSEKWDPSQLIGPGHLLGTLLQGWPRSSKEQNSPMDLAAISFPDEIAVLRRLEWLEDRLSRRLLRHNLPVSFREQFHEKLDVSKVMEELRDLFARKAAGWMAEPALPSFRIFKIFQSLTYLLILIFFLFAIGGEEAWRDVLDNPGINSVIGLILSGIQTLFSAKGLAALGSYALLNLFFAVRFYRRLRKRSETAAKKIIKTLKGELTEIWEEKMQSILDDINHFREDVRSQISAVSILTQKKG